MKPDKATEIDKKVTTETNVEYDTPLEDVVFSIDEDGS